MKATVILLLVGIAVYQNAALRFTWDAVDLYTFWSVPTAQRLSGYTLGSPYQALPEYGAFLQEFLVQHPDDSRLFRATAFWHGLPGERVRRNSTPLLYVMFGLLPESFTSAANLYQWTQLGLLLTAILLLTRHFRLNRFYGAAGGLVFLLIVFPVHKDLAFGNVNTILLFSLACLLNLYQALQNGTAGSRPVFAGLFGATIVFLVLFKPLVLVPCLLLAMLFAVNASGPHRVMALAGGCVTSLLSLFWPAWFFGSWSVWLDWLRTLIVKQTLVYSSEFENCSLVRILTEVSGLSSTTIMATIGGLLLVSILWAAGRQKYPFSERSGCLRWREKTRGILMEPGLVLSIGLILTLALSPLVWSHYYVLALIPVLWLCSRARGSGSVMGMLMAATFVLASSDMLIYVVVTMHLDWAWYTVTQASSWIPLWIGILATIASASPLAHSPGASLPSRTAARVPQPV